MEFLFPGCVWEERCSWCCDSLDVRKRLWATEMWTKGSGCLFSSYRNLNISLFMKHLHVWARNKAILLAFHRAPSIPACFLKPQISVYRITFVLVHCCTWHGEEEFAYLHKTYRWESGAGNTILDLCFQLFKEDSLTLTMSQFPLFTALSYLYITALQVFFKVHCGSEQLG